MTARIESRDDMRDSPVGKFQYGMN